MFLGSIELGLKVLAVLLGFSIAHAFKMILTPPSLGPETLSPKSRYPEPMQPPKKEETAKAATAVRGPGPASAGIKSGA